jgi:hypothetical protein
MFTGEFLRAIVAFAAFALGGHLGGGQALEARHR